MRDPWVDSEIESLIPSTEASQTAVEITMETPAIMNTPPSSIVWNEPRELRYETEENLASSSGAAGTSPPCCCFYCQATPTTDSESSDSDKSSFLVCSKCRVARYCSKDCQIQDWKRKPGGHKHSCLLYQRVGPHMSITSRDEQVHARNLIFARIRFYACPYAVHKSQTLGRGFLLIQSSGTLALMSLLGTQTDSYGRRTPMRSVLLHYLTLGEYDRDLCRDDFEMTIVRSELQKAVDAYDPVQEVVVLMKFRCGHLVLGVAPLVPDYGICKRLGLEYYATNEMEAALQLNLDDM